jgi:L-rhamnose mutarotase
MNLKAGYPAEAAGPTRRFCQVIKLNPDTLDEYRHWHSGRNIWPEIPAGIRRAGILDMEIYVPGAGDAGIAGDAIGIMILTTPTDFDWDASFGALAGFERQAEWEAFVAPFQRAGTGRSDEKWQLCERIFSLTEALKP